MNIEDYRDFCLSLGDGIEEKFPFSKFKTTFADITEDEARARGYIT